ncbi:MAG: protein-L-isoaspartate(D-aspartate) O-methyltransferase [Deferrisomatales bacterium]
MSFERPLRRLAEQLADGHGVRSAAVLAAMARVPRPLFVDEALRVRAFRDEALPIGFGQTISKPSTVARMTEALEPRPDDRVLEVGTGSGYQTAVLACLCGRVYSVERIPQLALRASRLLTQLGYHRVEVRLGDGALGWPEQAPFQGILVTAAAEGVPGALLEQLALGGRLVVPRREGNAQRLWRYVRVGADQWHEESLEACRFVPLVAGKRS